MLWKFVYNYLYEQTFSFLINNTKKWLDHIEGTHVSFLETDELSQKSHTILHSHQELMRVLILRMFVNAWYGQSF